MTAKIKFVGSAAKDGVYAIEPEKRGGSGSLGSKTAFVKCRAATQCYPRRRSLPHV